MLGRSFAIATVITVGVSITALELAAARLLAPFFGSTIFVWGSAIGVVLAALALGYWFGGKIADRNPSRGALAAIVLFAGVSAAFIPLVFRPVAAFIEGIGNVSHVPVGVLALITMSILFLLPVIALGAVSPYVLRLSLRSVNESGRWSGVLSGVSTVGSISGTFLAAFYTIPTIGTRATILIASATLILLGILLVPYGARPRLIPLFLLLPLSLGMTGPFLPRRGLTWERESPYQLVQVIRGKDQFYLLTDAGRGLQSVYKPGSPYTGYFYDAFGALPYIVDGGGQHRSVLVLGLGGGSMARLYRQALTDQFTFDIIGVEIDPSIVEAARRFFDLDHLNIRVTVDDARTYLRTTSDRFDIIIIDAYIHELQIPPLLATKEFFEGVRNHLAPGGVAAMNVVVDPQSRFFPKFLQTVRSVFPSVHAGPFYDGASNHFVMAGETIDLSRIPSSTTPEIDRFLRTALPRLRVVERNASDIFTDDRTDLELLLSQAWQKNV